MGDPGRRDYALRNSARYREMATNLRDGPASPTRRLEFAVLSANVAFSRAVGAWDNIRHASTAAEIDGGMLDAGLGLTTIKTPAIMWLRAHPDIYPRPDYRQYRQDIKLPGMMWTKLSFAACLIDPLRSNIICLDTHIMKVYTGLGPQITGRWMGGGWRYQRLENRLLFEAREVGLPPFPYQWAVWDYQRGQVEEHKFLWEAK
jgi:hypothetical protein